MGIPQAVLAVNRFGLGAKSGELDLVQKDPRGWIIGQIDNPVIPPEIKNSSQMAVKTAQEIKKLKAASGNDRQKMRETERKMDRQLFVEQTSARIMMHAQTDQPFVERMVLFWSNHFTVSTQRTGIIGLVHHFENEAIRPHINGRFVDMLQAVVHHPAMLLYLDNARSIGDQSPQGRKRQKGLNENLAREILELHTLGVNGGYTQNDIIAFANILTGWSVDQNDRLQFVFRPQTHQPGSKSFLGHEFLQNGQQEGVDALNMLAKHPATARHIATKLARHFISDTPSEESIKAIETTFLQSDGNLSKVMKKIIELKEIWDSPFKKYKTTYEFVVSALRLTGQGANSKQTMQALNVLDFRPFNASSPAGYEDTIDYWLAPNALIKRIEWANRIAQSLPAGVEPLSLAQAAFSTELSPNTAQIIERAASGPDGIVLLLSSPEFQRR